MKNKTTKLTALLLLGICFNQVYAQQATTASGGDASGSGGSVAYSVGQIVYTTNTGSNGSVTQGVQQPYEISITLGLAETGINLNLSAYPNPTTNYLMLQIDASAALSNQPMSYQLYDISGKLLESNTIVANSTTIKMEQLATGSYFLKVSQNNTLVKTFKIIKN
jgi:opacity protein-like surface antigen